LCISDLLAGIIWFKTQYSKTGWMLDVPFFFPIWDRAKR
jgi:hypothetical protein